MGRRIGAMLCALGVLVAGLTAVTGAPRAEAVISGAILFRADTADAYACYRIPSIVRTTAGTVLAFAQARRGTCADHGEADLVVRRSTDNGVHMVGHQGHRDRQRSGRHEPGRVEQRGADRRPGQRPDHGPGQRGNVGRRADGPSARQHQRRSHLLGSDVHPGGRIGPRLRCRRSRPRGVERPGRPRARHPARARRARRADGGPAVGHEPGRQSRARLQRRRRPDVAEGSDVPDGRRRPGWGAQPLRTQGRQHLCDGPRRERRRGRRVREVTRRQLRRRADLHRALPQRDDPGRAERSGRRPAASVHPRRGRLRSGALLVTVERPQPG